MKRKKLLSMLLSFGLVCQLLMIPTSASELDDNKGKVAENGYESVFDDFVYTESECAQELDLCLRVRVLYQQ